MLSLCEHREEVQQLLQTAVREVESPSQPLVIVSLSSARQDRQDPIVLTASASPDTAALMLTHSNHLCRELVKLTSQHLNFLSRCHRHSISQYHNTRNKSISQFQEYLLRYHARVGNDAKRAQSALCTRMRIVFYAIRLGPKTSVCRELCHCHVYCTRL